MLIPTIGFIVQIVVLALLIYGYWQYKRLVFKRHGKIMACATVLHLIANICSYDPFFFPRCNPSIYCSACFWARIPLSLIHVPLGISAASFGVWFVVAWRLQGLKGCFNRKRKMLLTMIVWLVSTLLGMALYAFFYWNLLMS